MERNGLRKRNKMQYIRKEMKAFVILVMMLIMTLCAGGEAAATARPLERSPGELAWEAWVHQDPRLHHGSDQQPPPRRITTKSLFVFPDLGPEALPACAEGYRPDSMGRCIKIVKLDETAHLEFLLQKLNSQFATESAENTDESYDYDIETEASDVSGPLQLNIPIAMQKQESHVEDSEGSGDSVVVFKKDTSHKEVPSVASALTSSPEVVPEYFNKPDIKNEPTETETEETTTEFMTTTTTSTLDDELISNSKTKDSQVISDKPKESSNNEMEKAKIKHHNKKKPDKELEKHDDSKLSNSNMASEKLSSIDQNLNENDNKENIEHHSIEKTKNNHKPLKSNGNTINENGDKNNNETLVEQIEALKKTNKNNETNLNNEPKNDIKNNNEETYKYDETSPKKDLLKEDSKNNHHDNKNILADANFDIINDASSKTMDIEDKIKVISRFADVSVNKDLPERTSFNIQKKTSINQNDNDHPHTNPINVFHQPSDMTISSGSVVCFPSESGSLVDNYYNIRNEMLHDSKEHSIEINHKFDVNGDLSQNVEHRLPYWWPHQNWESNQQNDNSKDGDIWSQMQIFPKYPYVYQEYNRHPSHYQTLYPNPHQSGGRINLRHATVTHRRGRPMFNSHHQSEHEEPLLYARGRHPHYRE